MRVVKRSLSLLVFSSMVAVAACMSSGAETDNKDSTASMPDSQAQVMMGRALIIEHACGDCHGGGDNPAAPGWLDGMRDTLLQQFRFGEFVMRPRNLTPDNQTGLGRFTERQIFNALRYGLRPGETPDVEITSTVPGQGNFPATPKYLAPAMPWLAWRHMSDEDLKAIAAYLKRGLKPSNHKVEDSSGPPDFWAEFYKPLIGNLPSPAFPTANEKQP
jgi:mono/diheme cytochrome c family protein